MAIDVSSANPTFVAVFSNTITTNTAFNTNPPNDRSYVFADDIVGTVNAGVAVGGFGLLLETTAGDGGIAMTNNGLVTVNQTTPAVHLIGHGVVITYAGTGAIANTGDGGALVIENDGAGTVDVTISNNIAGGDAAAVDIDTQAGDVTLTQAAGTFLTNVDRDVIAIDTTSGEIAVNLHGTIFGDDEGLNPFSISGDITVDFTGSITTADAVGINSSTAGAITLNSAGSITAAGGLRAQGRGDRITINVTAGVIQAINEGIVATSEGNGGILINMTGGQLGSGAQRVGVGIFLEITANATGDIDITSTDIFSSNNGIDAQMPFATATGDITITANGTTDSLAAFGIGVVNNGSGNTSITNNGLVSSGNAGILINSAGTGSTTVTNNGTVSGTAVGIFASAASTTVLNLGTIIGNMGVFFGAGNDTYDGRAGTVVGAVAGGAGDDVFFSGAGNETFDGFTEVDTVDYAGATGPVIVSLLAGAATGHGNDTLLNIENANGTSFGDTFIGNGFANRFNGRGGDDTFLVAPGGGADTIDGFLAGPDPEDRVDARAFADIGSLDAFLALAAQVGADTVIDFGGGDTLTLSNVAMTDLVDSDLILVAQLGDVLWRHDDGQVRTRDQDLGNVTGLFDIAGTGDFDGDGDADILWRHPDGLTVAWELQNGALQTVHNFGVVSTSFQIAGTGDFDNDGDDDILWRGNAGQVVIWEMEDGAFVTNHNQPAVPNSFDIAGAGDFDNDGDADILWRGNEGQVVIWEMQGGELVTNHNQPAVPTNFRIAGTGDFDGDGDADIVWRHDDGTTVTWEMEDGALAATHNFGVVPTNFQIAGTEDFDGDGDSDILWRQTGGTVVTWEMEDGALAATRNLGVTANTW